MENSSFQEEEKDNDTTIFWVKDHIIKRPLNEIIVMVKDKRSDHLLIPKRRIREFGWEGAD